MRVIGKTDSIHITRNGCYVVLTQKGKRKTPYRPIPRSKEEIERQMRRNEIQARRLENEKIQLENDLAVLTKIKLVANGG